MRFDKKMHGAIYFGEIERIFECCDLTRKSGPAPIVFSGKLKAFIFVRWDLTRKIGRDAKIP